MIIINSPRISCPVTKDTPDSDNDTTCLQLKADEGFRMSTQQTTGMQNSRPTSLCSEPTVDNAAQQCKKWVDTVSVPLMMAYITRYIFVSKSSPTWPLFVYL